jgi:ATP-dependent Lon protease
LDVKAARSILEEDHYGLAKAKRRIIEYLGVRQLAPDLRGPILCLVGPPGVGKTSLARSVARALERRFVRISLGGLRDEAEIRGHRRTYVGSMPGRILQAMKRAGSTNPVLLLDEIDKLVAPDLRGDPAGALLEILDPETNATFEDHYLGVPYDLSRVLFFCTANDGSRIPAVLRDRLEVIELSGYTNLEKLSICRRWLLPRAHRESGLPGVVPRMDDAVIDALTSEYTRESGVRGLERVTEALLRDLAMGVAEGQPVPEELRLADLRRVLGPPKYLPEIVEREPPVGVVAGLGWTATGGRLLMVEAQVSPGDGRVRLTGKLGEVMKESGQTALSLLRSRGEALGLARDFFATHDVHVHFPQGAVPKDGPSAGVTTTTALYSALTRMRVRTDIAMTGEVTLHGRVLPIGGVREKLVAAYRAGIREVILPAGNRKDEPDIPDEVRREVRLHFVEHIDEVLRLALLPPAAAA